MGTSTRLAGPVGGRWQAARGALTKSLKGLPDDLDAWQSSCDGGGRPVPNSDSRQMYAGWTDEKVDRHATDFYEAFSEHLRVEPTAFGLVEVSARSGARLVDILEELGRIGPNAFGLSVGATPAERAERFLGQFVAAVVGEGGLPADAAARRAVVQCGQLLLQEHHDLHHAIDQGDDLPGLTIDDRLFCEIYRLFFDGMVRELLSAVVAGKIMVATPMLPVVDPAGTIAARIAEWVIKRMPMPCEEKTRRGGNASVVDLGRELASHALEYAFGIDPGGAL